MIQENFTIHIFNFPTQTTATQVTVILYTNHELRIRIATKVAFITRAAVSTSYNATMVAVRINYKKMNPILGRTAKKIEVEVEGS